MKRLLKEPSGLVFINKYIKSKLQEKYFQHFGHEKSDQSPGFLPSSDEGWPRLLAENAKMCGTTKRGVMRLKMMEKLALFTA